MNEPLTSNPLVAKLRKAAVGRSDLCIAPIFVREIVKAADEIERLTALVDGGKQCVKFLEAAEAERDRLTATVEELRTVSAGLRAALERIADWFCGTDTNCPLMDDVHAMAREALAGAAVETEDA